MNKNSILHFDENHKYKIRVFAFIIVLAFIVLGFFMSYAGLRGSDQYWYVADTESLLNGNGVQTNNILSYNIVNDSIVKNNGFIHNVPQVYLAAFPGLLFGAFNGWLIMNAFFSIITSLLFFYVLKKHFTITLSGLIALQFLVMPLTFWQSYQPLAEAFHALLLTTILYIYYFNNNLRRYYLIGLMTVFLLLCRNNYILVVPVITILFYREIRTKYKMMYSILYFLAIVILFFVLKRLFPDTWNFSFFDILITSKVGELNASSIVELLKIYGNNIIGFFYKQFFTIGFTIIFYLPFNIFVIGTLIMLIKERTRKLSAPILIVSFTLLFLLLTTIISQNQSRYMLPFYPLVMFGFFIQIRKSLEKNLFYMIAIKFLVFTISLSVLINSFITYRTIKDGNTEKAQQNYYSKIYNKTISHNESVIFYFDNYLMHSYILSPRYVFLDLNDEKSFLNFDKYSILMSKYHIKWLITDDNYGQNIFFQNYKLELKETISTKNNASKGYIYKILHIEDLY